MKILLVNYRYFISGGPEKYMFNIKNMLEERRRQSMQHDEENSGQHYALVKLQESVRAVRQAVNEFPVLRRRIDRYQGKIGRAHV